MSPRHSYIAGHDRTRPQTCSIGRLIRCCLPVLLWGVLPPTGVSAAEPFRIVSASPESGSAGVPLHAFITIEFSEPLGYDTGDWNTAVVEPRRSARISSYQLCVNRDPCGGAGDARFVRYIVEHQPDTDFTWIFFTARSKTGEVLSEPFVLRYTTAADIGARSVSGSIVRETLPSTLPAATRSALWAFVSGAAGDPVRAPAFSPNVVSMQYSVERSRESEFAARAGVALEVPHERILLLERFSVDESEWVVRSATAVRSETAHYTVKHVRPGEYWPLLVRFTNAACTEIDGIGFHDRDGDGVADPIVVGDQDETAIHLHLFSFPLRPAMAGLAAARDRVGISGNDYELISVEAGHGLRTSGTAYAWSYGFRSFADESYATVAVHPLGEETRHDVLLETHRAMMAIDEFAIDSEQALQSVMFESGHTFVSGFAPAYVRTAMIGGDLSSRVDDERRLVWRVTIQTVTSARIRTMSRLVDMRTGTVLHSEREENGLRANSIEAHPNPFTSDSRIVLHIDRPGHARVSVFDLLGRRVDGLLEAHLHEGSHELTWAPSGAPSGVYVLRLEVNGSVETYRLIRAR
jgi:hypothetical protein